jgi:hypothetical protein
MTKLPLSEKIVGIWPWEIDELSVSITIHNVPESLLKEFAEKIIRPAYPGGVSDAIKDLMRKAVEEKKQKDFAKPQPCEENSIKT